MNKFDGADTISAIVLYSDVCDQLAYYIVYTIKSSEVMFWDDTIASVTDFDTFANDLQDLVTLNFNKSCHKLASYVQPHKLTTAWPPPL